MNPLSHPARHGTLISSWQEFANAPELVAFLVDPARRLTYVYERLAVCAGANNRSLPDRVVNAASRLLGGNAYWASLLRTRILRTPSRHEPDFVARMSSLPLQMVGYLYFAKSPFRPSIIKIGFTTRIPEVRVKSLMANSGEELTLLGSFAGTHMDEQILHCLNSESLVAGEWYLKPSRLPDVSFLAEAA